MSKMLLVWAQLLTLFGASLCAGAVSPSCHAIPIGWRSPATLMTEARIPCGQFMAPAVPFSILPLGSQNDVGPVSYEGQSEKDWKPHNRPKPCAPMVSKYHELSLARVDFGGPFAIRSSRHLNYLQALAAKADHYTFLPMSSVDQLCKTGVQFVDSRLIHRVNIHAGRFSVAEDPEAVKIFSAALGYSRIVTTDQSRFITEEIA